MAGPNSFRDPVTNRLKAFGFVQANAPGDLMRQEPEGFALDPRDGWQFDGVNWVAVDQSTKDAELTAKQRTTAQTLLTAPDGQNKFLRAIGHALLDQLNMIRSIIPRPIQSMTRVGQTVTVTCFLQHGLTNNETIFITGADQGAYNGGPFTITVLTPATFSYQVVGSPATPATGSITFILGTVQSLEPITVQQVVNAVTAKITNGDVDTGF